MGKTREVGAVEMEAIADDMEAQCSRAECRDAEGVWEVERSRDGIQSGSNAEVARVPVSTSRLGVLSGTSTKTPVRGVRWHLAEMAEAGVLIGNADVPCASA